MKKKIIFVVSFILVAIITCSFVLKNKLNNSPAFPHFKQAIIESEGTVNAMCNEEFVLSFSFLDEELYSEMYSNKNIKSILVYDKRNKTLTPNKWNIEMGFHTKNYSDKKLILLFNLPEPGEYMLEKIEITYIDNVKKSFNIGNYRLNITTKYEFPLNYPNANFGFQFIFDKTRSHITGIEVTISNPDTDFTITNINFGLINHYLDYKNISHMESNENEDYILNYYQKSVEKNEEWTQIFKEARIYEGQKIEYNELIYVRKKFNATLIYIPFLESPNTDKTIQRVASPEIYAKVNNKEIKLFEQYNTILVNPLPNITYDVSKYLKERGQ